jgi:hypothetical protein
MLIGMKPILVMLFVAARNGVTAQNDTLPDLVAAANITSCQSLLDGYTACLDNNLADSGLIDSCQLAFVSYENCVEALDLPDPEVLDISWCNGFYTAWSLCVTREGCGTACVGDEASPVSCTAYEEGVCDWKSCCPACEALIANSYMNCAMAGGGCTNPECPVGGDGDNGGGGSGTGGNVPTTASLAQHNRVSTMVAATATVMLFFFL